MSEEGLRVRPIINDDFHGPHKNIILVLLLGLSVWPSGLGRTPLMREGPGSSPGQTSLTQASIRNGRTYE